MSRTWKDRPVFVRKSNPRRTTVVEHHRHEPRYGYVAAPTVEDPHAVRRVVLEEWDGSCGLELTAGARRKIPARHQWRACNYEPASPQAIVPRDVRRLYSKAVRARERYVLDKWRAQAHSMLVVPEYGEKGQLVHVGVEYDIDEDMWLPEQHRHAVLGGGYWD